MVVAPDQLVVPTDQRKAIEKGEPGGYFPIKHTKIDTSWLTKFYFQQINFHKITVRPKKH